MILCMGGTEYKTKVSCQLVLRVLLGLSKLILCSNEVHFRIWFDLHESMGSPTTRVFQQLPDYDLVSTAASQSS